MDNKYEFRSWIAADGKLSTLTADDANTMQAIAERAGLPLGSEDGAIEMVTQIQAQIPHAREPEFRALYEWIKTRRKAGLEQWFAIREEEGLKIDPTTAEVDWKYAQVCDPYGVDPDLPEEYDCIGRAYFARRPGSEVWVCFDDLPDKTRDALWERHKSKLAFPAGLCLTPETDVQH